ncbi:hypothetical protein E3P98_01508 [Wallemia ichthyophaga]|nr:hypothetical protein E3P98_01508 [Wallemia ichthyophaga]
MVNLDEIDFNWLAARYSKLKPFVNKQNKINFKDEFLVQNKLMPTIPNRLDYLNWIKSIWRSHVSPGDTFNLIDIGTGYLPIYPILAARLFDNCLVYATDIDHSSLELAASNIDRNNLDDKIKLVGVDRDDNNLIPSEITDNHAQFDFLIMNPPFYDAGQVNRQNIKSNHPSGLNLGSTNELYTEGGELGFILKLINQSIKLKHKVVWYSTLIGIKSNLSILIKYLNKHNISNYALNVINRGNTLRWLLAWSFLPYRLDNSLARSNNKSLFKLNPPSTHHTHNLNHPINLDAMISLINQLSSVYISHRSEGSVFVIIMGINSWSRSSRRAATNPLTAHFNPTKLSISIESHEPNSNTLHFRWLEGFDFQLFISFVKHISTKASSHTSSTSI